MANERERFQIFTYIVHSRLRALGTQEMAGEFDGNANLADFGFNKKRYSHSRQFRSNIVSEFPYWNKILEIIAE